MSLFARLTNILSDLYGAVGRVVHSISPMENLVMISDICRPSEDVKRILGQNPGKFTLQGTNTYLLGRSPPYVLIDTGEGGRADTSYLPLLETALKEGLRQHGGTTSSDDERQANRAPSLVSDIIITHAHKDHFGGLPGVLELLRRLHNEGMRQGHSKVEYTPPRIHKNLRCPPEFNGAEEFAKLVKSLPRDLYLPADSPLQNDLNKIMVHHLEDGQKLRIRDRGGEGEGEITVLHTPGHTPDSVCLLFRSASLAPGEEQENSYSILFSGDTILGQGTGVFEDLNVYLASLHRLASLEKKHMNFNKIYPGHGPVIEDGPARIREYIAHREQREAEILALLTSGKSPSPQLIATSSEDAESVYPAWRIWDIVAEIYKNYSKSLWLPAGRGVRLHLQRLMDHGRVECLGGEGAEEYWRATGSINTSQDTRDETTKVSDSVNANSKQFFHPIIEISALRM